MNKNKMLIFCLGLVLISMILAIVLVGNFQLFGLLANHGVPTIDEQLEAWSEASYVVWKYNSTHTATWNCSTNTVEWISTNASAVINNAIGNLTSGVVFLKTGKYYITCSIVLKTHVDIVGEGYLNTVLAMATDNTSMFVSPNRNTKAVRSSIRDICLHGNRTYYDSTYGIEAIINRASIERVSIKQFGIAGIRFFGSGPTWATQRTCGVKILNSIISNNGKAQIIWDAYSGDCFIDNVEIYGGASEPYGIWHRNGGTGNVYSNVHINRCKSSVYLQKGGVEFTQCCFDGDTDSYSVTEEHVLIKPKSTSIGQINFHGCKFLTTHRANDTYSVIKLDGTKGQIAFVKIHGSRFGTSKTKKPKYIYEEVGGANISYVLLIGNTFTPGTYTAPSPLSIASSSTTVRENIGFVTENSGTITNCVNGTWVSHGLAGTPNRVTLTISGSNYINSTCYLIAPTITASNSTHFQMGFYIYDDGTITAVTSTYQRDITWYAEYKP